MAASLLLRHAETREQKAREQKLYGIGAYRLAMPGVFTDGHLPPTFSRGAVEEAKAFSAATAAAAFFCDSSSLVRPDKSPNLLSDGRRP